MADSKASWKNLLVTMVYETTINENSNYLINVDPFTYMKWIIFSGNNIYELMY